MSKYIAVEMPEQNEGKEVAVVCLVKNANLQEVKKSVFGKGYGVQGYDDGVEAYELDTAKNLAYVVPILNFDDFKSALLRGELNWYKVAGWQRWGRGYVDQVKNLVVLSNQNVIISDCFKKCGYKIVTVTLD